MGERKREAPVLCQVQLLAARDRYSHFCGLPRHLSGVVLTPALVASATSPRQSAGRARATLKRATSVQGRRANPHVLERERPASWRSARLLYDGVTPAKATAVFLNFFLFFFLSPGCF